jgi:hypothetical protein
MPQHHRSVLGRHSAAARYAALAVLAALLSAGAALALLHERTQEQERATARVERPNPKQPAVKRLAERAGAKSPFANLPSMTHPVEPPSAERPPAEEAPAEPPPAQEAPVEPPGDVDDDPDGGSHESSDGDSSYLDEDRCQPMDDMNDPSDGVVPSPEELLPDPSECPEFYEGDGNVTGAPPVTGVPAVPVIPPSEEPVTPSYNPCAETASLNGFPCYPTPSGPVYVDPYP